MIFWQIIGKAGEDGAKAKSSGPMIREIDAFADLLVGSGEIERQLIAFLAQGQF